MGSKLGTQATVEKRWGQQEFYWHGTFSRSFFFLKRFFSLTCRASFLQAPGGQTFWFFFSAQFDQILETRVRKCLGKVYLSIMLSFVHWSFFGFSYLPLLLIQAPTIRDDLRIHPVFHLQPLWLPQVSPATGGRVSLTWIFALRWVRLAGKRRQRGSALDIFGRMLSSGDLLMSYVSWRQRRSARQFTNWNVLKEFLREYPPSWGLSRV